MGLSWADLGATGSAGIRRIVRVFYALVGVLLLLQLGRAWVELSMARGHDALSEFVNGSGRLRFYSERAVSSAILESAKDKRLVPERNWETVLQEWSDHDRALGALSATTLRGYEISQFEKLLAEGARLRTLLSDPGASPIELRQDQAVFVQQVDMMNARVSRRFESEVARQLAIERIFGLLNIAVLLTVGFAVLRPLLRQLLLAAETTERNQEQLEDQQLELQAQQDDLKEALSREARTKELFEWASRRLESLFQAIPTACFTVDTEGNVQEWNLLAETLWGVSAPMAVFQPYDYVFASPPVPIDELLSATRVDGREVLTEVNGIEKWVHVTAYPLCDPYGQQVGAVVAALDITERKRQEEALAKSEKLLQTITDKMNDAVLIQDADGRILFANPVSEKLLEMTRDELFNSGSFDPRWQLVNEDMKPVRPEDQPSMRSVLRGETVVDATIGLHHDDGRLTWLAISSTPIESQGDRPWALVTFSDVTEDINQRRMLESELSLMSGYTQELAEVNERLFKEAVTDALTGLPNRRALDEALRKEMEALEQLDQPFSFLLMDVDRFKHYNDTFGHPAGDEVLRQIGACLREISREADIACRYGGEEFAVLLRNTKAEEAFHCAERVRKHIASQGWELREVTVSVGAASYERGEKVSDLVARADEALYLSKANGRNQVTLASQRPAA